MLEGLRTVGIGEEIQRVVEEVLWKGFIEVKEHTMRELLLEFLSIFAFYKMNRIDYDREDVIKFNLGGI